MDALTLTAFLLVEIIFVAFIFVIARSGLKDKVKRSFLYFLVAFSLWGAANYASNLTFLSPEIILQLNHALFFVSPFGLLTLLMFIIASTHQTISKGKEIFLGITVSLAAIMSLTPWVVTTAYEDQPGVVAVEFGFLALPYFLLIVYLCGLIFYRLIRAMRQRTRRDRSRAKVLFVSIGIAMVTILLSNVILPVFFNIFSVTMVGMFAGMFIIVGVSYGIVRHGMFDIKYAAVRSVTYGMVLVTLAVLYFLIAIIISNLFGNVFLDSQQAISGVAISLVLALVFQPVKQFFDRITNKVFYKDAYTSEEFFASLNRIVVSTTDLRSLLKRAAHYIAQTIKSEQAFFLIAIPNRSYLSAGTDTSRKVPAADIALLRDYFTHHDEFLDAAVLAKTDPLKRLLMTYRIELVVPLFQANDLIGMLCLGDHLNAGFSPRDLRLLGTASDELAVGIQNALSIEEVRELNANLEQRIATATKELRASNAQLQRLDEAKDEFISMASHQLRTPLTSIKGYISMLMEGDVGKVTPQQKHILGEAFISSERMVRLIGDFLNVSRLQTGKFVIEKHPVDLAQLVQSEIESLETNAAARGLSFEYKKPKNIPKLSLDENKIQQVVMNFSDNAIYYSKEASKIKVNLKLTNGFVEFTVVDHGIGVPKEQQEQLFNKFFRATNARQQRPDGTGVGLFLAKKVIDAHHGEIIFTSKENVGSTFGFRVPVEKLRA